MDETPQGAGASGPLPDAAPPSLADAVGGWLGLAESSLPAAVFVAVYTANGQDTQSAAIAAAALALVLAVARIVRRQTPLFALSGVVGVVIAGYVATRTGKAENFFLPGLLLNLAYGSAFAVSIVARWPLLGVMVGNITREGNGWRDDPALLGAYSRASWIWVGLFALRIAVQLPLYLASALVALGIAKVAMGVPLFVVGIWLSYLMLRSVGGGPWARRDPAAS
jgi:intracellular septation protein A